MKKLLAITALLLSSFAHAGVQQAPRSPGSCAMQTPFGTPQVQKQNSTLICRAAYMLEHDNNAKIPVWVSYVLSPEHAVGCESRTNAFSADYSLLRGRRSEIKDYSNSGYDTGHIANNADMSWSIITEQESFILSNMTPQLPGFNRGVWKRLEDKTRALVMSRNTSVLIYAGPIYRYDDPTIGDDKVIIPSGFYKILVDLNTHEVLVYEFKHEPSQNSLDAFITDLNTVRRHTGIQFPMPPDAKFSRITWNSKNNSVRALKKNSCNLSW